MTTQGSNDRRVDGVASLTARQARYYALDPRRRGIPGEVEGVGSALFDARVDLNPHQVEAALFGLRALRESGGGAPGRILADEVGLGKTIEAGLILCQLWAERKRRLLVVVPAALRKQWALEIEARFGIPARYTERRAITRRFRASSAARRARGVPRRRGLFRDHRGSRDGEGLMPRLTQVAGLERLEREGACHA